MGIGILTMFVLKDEELGLFKLLGALVLHSACLVLISFHRLNGTLTPLHRGFQAPSVQQIGHRRVGEKVMSFWGSGPIVAHPEADSANLGYRIVFRSRRQSI